MQPDPMMIYGSLCSGIGGLDLACQELGWRCAVYVEKNLYRQAVLLAHMRDGRLDCAPIWPNLRTFNGLEWRGKLDCLVAGFPCPPFSTAGRHRGAADPRNLWPDVRRTISEVRPNVIWLENVAGLAFRIRTTPAYAWTVLADITALGYDARWGIVSAKAVGAPHRRGRWWCVAYTNGAGGPEQAGQYQGMGWTEFLNSNGEGEALDDANCDSGRIHKSTGWQLQAWVNGSGQAMGNATGTRLPWPRQHCLGPWPPEPTDTLAWEHVLQKRPDLAPDIGGKLGVPFVTWLMGFPERWTEVPGATRRRQIEALGDAVVPAQALLAYKLLTQS